MRYTLKVLKGGSAVFQSMYDDLDVASGHVTEVAGKYAPGYTVKLYDGSTEIQSADGTGGGRHDT